MNDILDRCVAVLRASESASIAARVKALSERSGHAPEHIERVLRRSLFEELRKCLSVSIGERRSFE